ncbi:AAA family ATPase, partial [Aeromonas caviae]|nr:AAA family ATPase [Aeromonas caviae]
LQGRLVQFLVLLVCATGPGCGVCPELDPLVAVGASPRASIGLARAARARAWLVGRVFVLPVVILHLAPAVLRVRLIPSFEAVAVNLVSEALITLLLNA